MPELYESEAFVYNQIPVRVIRHCLDGGDIYTPLHWHRNVEFDLTTAGRIFLNIDGRSEQLGAGDWRVVNSGDLHSNHWVELGDHFEGITVQVAKPFIDRWIGEDARFAWPESPGAAVEVENALRTFGEYQVKGDSSDLEKMELVFHFLAVLRKYCYIRPDAANGKHEKDVGSIKGIVNYIDDHYAEPIDLASIAEEFHYTPAHLSRMFKEHIGYNFYQYLQNVRLMHCMDEMKADQNIRLIDCAMDNGFPNVKSFIQTFKKNFGCTPSEWMKQRGGA